MKNFIYMIGASLMLGFNPIVHAATPEGNWRTYDLKHHVRSIVKFTVVGHSLTGRINKVFSTGNQVNCSACKGKWHNKPLVGLPIIWGLKKDNDQWVHGHVLNTDDGKVYQCDIKVSKNNQVMYFTAYLGLPLFGKTLKWERVN